MPDNTPRCSNCDHLSVLDPASGSYSRCMVNGGARFRMDKECGEHSGNPRKAWYAGQPQPVEVK